jgi:hypothetical protein
MAAALLTAAIWGDSRLNAQSSLEPDSTARVLSHFKELDEISLGRMLDILIHLGEGKPESAAKLFEENLKKVLNVDTEFSEKVRRDFSKLAGRLTSMQSVEYIGYNRLSKNLSFALFALNSEYGAHYFVFPLVLQSGQWRFSGYQWITEWEDMAKLKVTVSEKAVVLWEFQKP